MEGLSPVARLVLDRARAGSRPGERDDGTRLVLVAEGGGMRGVVAGGMATALEELDVVEAFDGVYGTSAGALGGAFLLAGQAALGTSLYFDDLTTPEFIAKRRVLTRGAMMSLEFLLDEIMSGRKPLDWQRVVDHGVRLHPFAADLDAGELVDLHGEACDVARLREALRASARVPGVAGPPVCIGDRRLVDGSVLSPIPFARAIADGATHLMVLRTRPFGTTLRAPPAVVRPPLERWLRRLHPTLP
ncbi:MAG TPA: patatin-like phospholipase family protein, partial [Solirubrobacteraceae bacterium]|nr:patatin-like phospholipase family protein [Solirubrobacteraceae bacterium]